MCLQRRTCTRVPVRTNVMAYVKRSELATPKSNLSATVTNLTFSGRLVLFCCGRKFCPRCFHLRHRLWVQHHGRDLLPTDVVAAMSTVYLGPPQLHRLLKPTVDNVDEEILVVDAAASLTFDAFVNGNGDIVVCGMLQVPAAALRPVATDSPGHDIIDLAGTHRAPQVSDSDVGVPRPPRCLGVVDKFCAVSCGRAHILARTQHGSAYCWGDNNHGQLGVRGVSTNRCESP